MEMVGEGDRWGGAKVSSLFSHPHLLSPLPLLQFSGGASTSCYGSSGRFLVGTPGYWSDEATPPPSYTPLPPPYPTIPALHAHLQTLPPSSPTSHHHLPPSLVLSHPPTHRPTLSVFPTFLCWCVTVMACHLAGMSCSPTSSPRFGVKHLLLVSDSAHVYTLTHTHTHIHTNTQTDEMLC